MTEDVIKLYEILTKKDVQMNYFFDDFHDQIISTQYYDFLNDNYGNNIPGTLVDNFFPDNKGWKIN